MGCAYKQSRMTFMKENNIMKPIILYSKDSLRQKERLADKVLPWRVKSKAKGCSSLLATLGSFNSFEPFWMLMRGNLTMTEGWSFPTPALESTHCLLLKQEKGLKEGRATSRPPQGHRLHRDRHSSLYQERTTDGLVPVSLKVFVQMRQEHHRALGLYN